MLILAADTSGKNGSLALVRFEAGPPRTLEIVSLEGGNFSAQLVPQVSDLLSKHRLTKKDIDGFAAAAGPGSFTGLRVGLAAIKALAEVLQKPIAAVSLLEAVARAAEHEGNVLAVLDAGRSDVYCGDFEIRGSRATLISQQLWTEAEFIAATGGRFVATPDVKIANLARANHSPAILIAAPPAETIARLGFEKIQAGESVTPEALDAMYIRRSDAEIQKDIRAELP